MRILLTGHKGYIGVVLTRLLLESGHEVHGLDSDLYSPLHVRCRTTNNPRDLQGHSRCGVGRRQGLRRNTTSRGIVQ